MSETSIVCIIIQKAHIPMLYTKICLSSKFVSTMTQIINPTQFDYYTEYNEMFYHALIKIHEDISP